MAAARPPARRITPPAHQLDLREQAAISKQKLGPGRRIFVDLQKDGNVVDWHKLLKAAGTGHAPTSPAAGPGEPPAAPGNLFKEPSRPKNAFSSVIQRLEQAYVMNDGEGSSSSSEAASEGAADSGQSAEVEGEEKRGGESGKESGREGAAGAAKSKRASAGGGAPRDDQYDYDDNFIDDSEFIEYYGGDRRRAKHSGFFVNSGNIEKTGELIDRQEASPKRRRKKSAPAAEAGSGDGAPLPKRQKQTQPTQACATAGPAPAFAHEVILETRDGFEQQPASALPARIAAGAEASAGGISGQPPAAAPASAQKKKAASGGPAGDKPYLASKEADAAVEALRQLAATEAGAAPPEGAAKKIPEALRSKLTEEFIGPYIREVNKHKDAQPTLVGRLMQFMEPFTTRGNLLRLLNQGKTKVMTDYGDAKDKLRGHLSVGCQAAEGKVGVQGAAARGHFVWTPELMSTMVRFVHLRGLVKGRLMIENGKIWGQIADLFDHHLMDAASVEKAYRSAVASGMAGAAAAAPAAAAIPAATPLAIPASAAPAQLAAVMPAAAPAQVASIVQQAAAPSPTVPAISPAAGAVPVAAAAVPVSAAAPAAPAAQPAVPLVLPPLRKDSSSAVQFPPQRLPAVHSPLGQGLTGHGSGSNPPSELPAGEGSNAAAAAAPDVDPMPHIAAGVLLGGDAGQLAASVRAFSKGTMKFFVNLTLMHAGARGFKMGEIVEQAAAAGIADWRDRGKRNYLSTVVSKEAAFVNVGTYHYALRAFPGVAAAGASVESAKAAANAAHRVHPTAAASAPSAVSQTQPLTSPLQLLGEHLLLSGSLPPVASNAAPQPPQSDTNFGGS